MQLSKLEDLTINELNKNKFVVFRIRDICLILNIEKTKAYNLVKALKKKSVIKKAGKSFFTLKNMNEFVIASAINYPSYISFWSALNYYGWSDQNPKRIFLATTKYSKEINDFKYITISKKRFFGYIKEGDITIAEKEKAIIDSLLFPKYAGGIREINTCLENGLDELDKKKLINYALKVGSMAVVRRLGFILEQLSYKKIEKLRKHIGKGYERLDPSLKKKNNFNKKWLLDINW